jgi:hypothetical protein
MVIPITSVQFEERLKVLCAKTKAEDRLSVTHSDDFALGSIEYPGVGIIWKLHPGTLHIMIVRRDGSITVSKVKDRISSWFGEE